jgi:NCS1 family nucleobase:cation symporter-1
VPEILIMTLGAVVGTFVLKIGTGSGGLLPFAHTSAIPPWFVVLFLVFAIIQIFGINSLDMYSSGVTLQAMGAPVKRYQAVLIDCVIAFGITMYAIFSASFTQYLSDFVDIVIIWIAPWSAIFLVDWVLRRYRYVPSALQDTGRSSLYWRTGGIHWPAWIAQIVGMFAAISALYVDPQFYFKVPVWLNEVTAHTRDSYGFGGDFSVFLGMGVGGLVYAILAWRGVRGREADAQDDLLRRERLLEA